MGGRGPSTWGVCGGVAAVFLCLVLTAAAQAALPDGRGWEMVSPIVKNGGQIEGPGGVAGGGVFQAAADGQSLTYSSVSSFGEAEGAPPGSQYLARRGAGGWASENISPPLLSGGYADEGEGVPYQLFSPDLGLGLLSNGKRCRGEQSQGCPVPNPPPPGSGAPVGYRNYYLRDSVTGAYRALITSEDAPDLSLAPGEFEVTSAGATADLRHVVLSTCAALNGEAVEIPAAEGCDEGSQNLYEWSGGALRAINILPGDLKTTPGAALAAQVGAISASGSRVYFTSSEDAFIYLREGSATKLVAAGGGAAFQTASADGAVAFYTVGSELFRYRAVPGASDPIAGEVEGVLGASADGSVLYYRSASGLYRWHEGTATKIAAAADSSNYPPSSGAARVSADGSQLLFLSSASLTGYDNTDRNSGEPDSEVYLYNGGLRCLSCRPSGAHPSGASTVPGAVANGEGPEATDSYKPRVLVAAGARVLFDSADALLSVDTDGRPDVYEWEAAGTGSCATAGGCLGLLSSGRSGGASFIDSSADGADVFFLTDASLIGLDPGSGDLYDARVGGGFPEPAPAIPCNGDDCQGPAPGPEDPTPGTATFEGPVNPPARFGTHKCPKGKRSVVKRGHVRCVRKRHRSHRSAGR